MKRIVCEVCGSNNLLKQDGVFVCQDCGCRYTLEEVRKMAAEETEEAAETVKADNTPAFSNYLDMAKSARDANNYGEAEEYCKKVLETDTSVWEAWYIRGTAAGWQSSLANIRLSEMSNYISRALKECPAEERQRLKNDCEAGIRAVSMAIVELRLENFHKYPSGFHSSDLENDLNQIKRYTYAFLKEINAYRGDTDEGLLYVKKITSFLDRLWKEVYPDFCNVNGGHPLQYDFDKFLNSAEAMYDSAVTATNILGCEYDNEEANELIIKTYKQMNKWNKATMDAYAWRIDSGSYCGYSKASRLSDEAKDERYQLIENVNKAIERITEKGPECVAARKKKEEAERKKRVDEYWAGHPDEKAKLEAERKSESDLLQALKSEIEALPEAENVRSIMREADEATKAYESLGLFKIKEKKAAKERIQQLRDRLIKANADFFDASGSMKDECEKHEARIRGIEEELTRDRLTE